MDSNRTEQSTSLPLRALGAMVLFLSGLFTSVSATEINPWVIVDTETRTLTVLQGATVLARYDDIALGRGGVGITRRQGDGKTPVGIFHVAWVNRNSRFRLFFGLDFPNLDHAHRAYTAQLIDSGQFDAIKTAFERRETPPQDTPLGGFLGIHGIGDGSQRVHSQFNWTDGCVAVTNEQILQLDQWVTVGTKVVIY